MSRRYGQFCGLAHALDLVGGRWSPLIIRDLLTGPKRFGELEESLAGIPTNILSGRLRELEESGIVQRRLLARPARGVAYELTDYGRELEEPLVQLGLWGAKSLGTPKEGDTVSVNGLALVLRSAFHPEHAVDVCRTYELQLDGKSLFLTVGDGRVSIVSDVAHPDVVLRTSPVANGALIRGRLRVDDALARGLLHVNGTKAEARRFFKMFRLPAEATRRSG